MRALARLRSVVPATAQDRRGVAAVEFALIMPVLVTLLFGVYHIGNAVHEMLLLQQALRAGGLYALSFPTQLGADLLPTTPNNGILLAIQEALPAGWTANAAGTAGWTPTVNLTPPALTKTACPAGPHTPPHCVTVTLNALLTDAWLSALNMNSVSYVIRVQ